jgi:molybdate transport system ATP-binding protein
MTGTSFPDRFGALDAGISVHRAGFSLVADVHVPAGCVLAVVGPNGAGKSTLLAALAGLAPLDEGRIQLADRVQDDTQAGVHVRPEARGIGMLFQDSLLFPHLDARDNVAFGLRASGLPRAAGRREALQWLHRLDVGELADRRPRQLSGGQAQRVALARALAPGPALVLLDEPLAALDAATRLSVRSELRRHLAAYGAPAVLVTHDPIEALVLGDRLLVLEHGTVTQQGDPADVARHPRTDYVARLVGVNLLRGTARAGTVTVGSGGQLTIADTSTRGEVFLSIRPSSVSLSLAAPHGSARNTWQATVSGLEAAGDRVRIALDGAPALLADVTAAAVAELRLVPGEQVFAAVKATDIDVYPA